MNKKHSQLINYLLEQNTPITSNNLADILEVSVRSIKNYITEINNNQYGLKVISSTKKGYLINKVVAKKILSFSKVNNGIPKNYTERSFYIIKQFLINNFLYLDLYELCDTLYVSYSTLKTDIAKMNKTFREFGISFICETDNLKIVGEEKNKRKLISYILFEESNNNFIDLSVLKRNFDNAEIDKISVIITNVFKKYNYYINDFSYMNLILHLLILIERVKSGEFIVNNNDYCLIDGSEQPLIDELSSEIETKFNLNLTKSEKFELYILFKTNANYLISSNISDLKKLVGSEIINLTQNIITSVNTTYLVNLLNDSFLNPFALHLKSLLARCKNNTYIRNPMVDTIKKQCPIMYDIAIFISFKLNEILNIEINEDEIAYLALHVGAEIERQKTNIDKINCVLLSPEYMSINTKLYNNILLEFGNQLNIIASASYEYQLEVLEFDLLITTLKIESTTSYEIVLVSPFFNSADNNKIYNSIDKIITNKKYSILKNNFDHFFNENLFFQNLDIATKEDLISIVSDRMLELDCVNENFRQRVLEREKASSTAFGNIAIPHSVHMDAIQTSISVITSRKGIKWDNNLVNLVLLVAINKFDKKTFRDLYEAILNLFTQSEIIDLVKDCTNFKEFKKLIYSNIPDI